MAGRTEGGFLVRGAEREFVKIVLADQDGTGISKSLDNRRIPARDVMSPHVGRRGCSKSCDVDEILERDRDPVQNAARASGSDLAVRLSRLLHRPVSEDLDEGVQRGVAYSDRVETLRGDLFGSDLA